MKAIEIVLDKENAVRLNAYLHEYSNEYAGISKRPAVLVLPGGGYAVCSDREADAPAFCFLNAGFHAIILRYTTKDKRGWPAPLEDYEKAMEYISAHAEEWGIDRERIAVCGFSAGGHLAACAATVAEHKPAAAILGYAALDRELVSVIAPEAPVPTQSVNGDTCPCFLFGPRTDAIVDISNTIEFERQLVKYGIAFESHIYGAGQHGFTTGASELNGKDLTPRARNWVNDGIAWLQELWGMLTANGYGKPLFDRKINGNSEKNLSVYCTYGYLSQFREAKKAMTCLEEKTKIFPPNILQVFRAARMIDLLNALGFSEGEISEINDELNKIENKSI